MNAYIIHHKIKAIAHLGFEFEYAGYKFTPYEPERQFASEEWLAVKGIAAEDYHKASLQFRLELIPVLDALSVLTQCSFTVIAMSFFICRLNENPDTKFYLYIARDSKTVGMPFWEKDQIADLERLLQIENKVALHYLRESNNSSTAKTRLAMLVIAAEALSGQTRRTRKCPKCGNEESYGATDRARLEAIVGKVVFDRLYVKDQGALRHRLFHGNIIPDADVVEVVPAIYDNILDFLKGDRGLTTVHKIVAAPRSFTSFEHGGLFLKPQVPGVPDLRGVEKNFKDQARFEFVDEPANY